MRRVRSHEADTLAPMDDNGEAGDGGRPAPDCALGRMPPCEQEQTVLTATRDDPNAAAAPPPFVDESNRTARPGLSPQAIDRYIAEERASWGERDRRIEECHAEARAQSRRSEREERPAPGLTMATGDVSSGRSSRTVGRRSAPPAGVLRAPTPEEEDWVRRMSAYRTRVPKGVFCYRSAEESNADWERWRAAMLAEGAGIERVGDGR